MEGGGGRREIDGLDDGSRFQIREGHSVGIDTCAVRVRREWNERKGHTWLAVVRVGRGEMREFLIMSRESLGVDDLADRALELCLAV